MKYLTTPFQPDYQNLVDAARNRLPKRLPLYEHLVNWPVIDHVLGQTMKPSEVEGLSDLDASYRKQIYFFRQMGYDAYSFEVCFGSAFPGGGALGGHIKGVIGDRADFDRYPWDTIVDSYFRIAVPHYEAVKRNLLPGMKAVGGVGNGVFEVVQDLTGYMDLCLIREDDPELYAELFQKVGAIQYQIWERMLDMYGDIFCVFRYGDDLGYKMGTMLPPNDVRQHILPQYKRVIGMIKAKTGKPFLLHSCGNLVDVMDEIIACGIDAKHSNEDVIAPFSEYITRYHDRIALFGGIDTDALCDVSGVDLKPYMENILSLTVGKPGFALGSGNSVTAYVSFDRYFMMNEMIRIARGE